MSEHRELVTGGEVVREAVGFAASVQVKDEGTVGTRARVVHVGFHRSLVRVHTQNPRLELRRGRHSVDEAPKTWRYGQS